MSLRTRLSLIVSLLCLTSIVMGTGYLVSSAKQRVADEMESSATLAFQLLNALLADQNTSESDADTAQLLQRLNQIQDARHLDISIVQPGATPETTLAGALTTEAPAWFTASVRPETLEYRIPLNDASQQSILLKANPADEIVEAWTESKLLITLLALVLVALNSILYFIIGRWFRPVRDIVQGLDAVEHGNFDRLEARTSLPELQVIAEKINSLAGVLKTAQEENRLLVKKSLRIQEEERRILAHELHDDMGQSISAIKAIAYSIQQRDSDKNTTAGAEKIGVISNHMHSHVRGMMSKLRPTMLDELGLIPALQHMIDGWNDHHSDTFCSVTIAEDFEKLDPESKINIYRIVQEALTNVAKHSQASDVKVELSYHNQYSLSVTDNGVGFDVGQTHEGLGLVGISERAQALGGHCKIETAQGEGVSITIGFGNQQVRGTRK